MPLLFAGRLFTKYLNKNKGDSFRACTFKDKFAMTASYPL